MAKPVVLVVDDNPTVVDLICRMLKLDGTYQPVTALNGIEALEAFEEHQPICLIVDAKMPNLDGFQLLRALRGDSQTDNVGLVMLTAMTQPQYERIGLFSGADLYLTKPFKFDDLLNAIRSALKITPQQRALRMQMYEKQIALEDQSVTSGSSFDLPE